MYPLIAPDNPVVPYIVYQNIVTTPEVTLADGAPLNSARMQIDLYDKVFLNVKTLSTQVAAAMAASALVNIPLTNQDMYEPEVKLYRVIMEYSIWF